MKRNALMILMLCLNAAPALAADTLFGAPMAMVAQLGQDERRALRERWERAGPEERAVMRREFRERLRHLPPEERDARMRDWLPRWQEPPREERPVQNRWRGDPSPAEALGFPGMDPGSFGKGFERRRSEDGYGGDRYDSDPESHRGRGRR